MKDYEALSKKHFDGQAAEYDQRDTYYYSQKNELMKLGLPEHLLLWPAVFCPLVGVLAAGIGTLIR